MSETPEARLKRLAMRSMRRGIKEMDLILSDFAAQRLTDMAEADLRVYDALLSENDQEVYAWILGNETTPPRYRALIGEIAAHAGAVRR